MSWAGYLVLGWAAVMTAYLLWTRLSLQGVAGRPIDPLLPLLTDLPAQQAKAVIYCHSVHCAPCRRLLPEIERLRRDHANVFALDISAHPQEARALGLQATPTTLLVIEGKVLKALLGVGALPAIEVFLRQG